MIRAVTLAPMVTQRQGAGLSPSRADHATRANFAWLRVLCISLLGYAVLGRGWAYVGFPPLYIGEATLLAGAVVAFFTVRWSRLRGLAPLPWMAMLMAWGLARTWPYLHEYGIDAARDAAVWGYAITALLVAGFLTATPPLLPWLLRQYQRFWRITLALVAVVWLACRFAPDSIPTLPLTGMPLADLRSGDVLVHMAGIAAFMAVGLDQRIRWFWLVLLLVTAGMAGAYERAGLVAFLAALAIVYFFRPLSAPLRAMLTIALLGLVLVAATGVRVVIPSDEGGKQRELSFEQFVHNFASMFGSTDAGDLDDTKQWRILWWNTIVDYTVHGRYFWTGKGFGINLADDDGFQVRQDHSLRSPHNGHLTVLARAGVPGFVLWAGVHLSWAACIARAAMRSQRKGQRRWSALFIFLLAYWAAFIVNASFDVFLEGPMGGIWYWTLFGVGLAALALWRRAPQLMENDADRAGAQLLPAARR